MTDYKNRTGIAIPTDGDTAAIEALDAVLHDVNGRSKTHTFNARRLVSVVERAEERLDYSEFLERERCGVTIEARSGGPTASSYMGRFNFTRATLVRRAGGWYLVAAKLDDMSAGKGADQREEIIVSASVAAAVQRRVLAGITVKEPRKMAA